MITLTLEQLINSTEGLKGLGQKQLKARCAYTVGKLMKQAENEITSFNEARADLIKKYGEKDVNGELVTAENGNVKIPNEVLADFNKEFKELLDTEIEINSNKIQMADLENVNFTPAEMAQLDEFIEFEE